MMKRNGLIWVMSGLMIILGIAELIISIFDFQFPLPVSIVLGILLIVLGIYQILRQRK